MKRRNLEWYVHWRDCDPRLAKIGKPRAKRWIDVTCPNCLTAGPTEKAKTAI